jgi:hypothetical protein
LLTALEPDVYVIDTSSWLNLEERPDFEDAWQIVVSLTQEGRVVVCAQVFAELRATSIMELLKPYEKELKAGDRNDPEYLMHVGRITHAHPSMSRATSRKTPADPYIVALAECENFVVVTDESARHPARKIPGVCAMRKIRCMNLDQFIRGQKETLDKEK